MRRAVVSVVAAATLGVGGCGAGAESHPESSSVATPSEQPVTTVEIPNLPDQLPAKVATAALNAVGIRVGLIINQGSGVRVNNKYVLTAGHVVSADEPDIYRQITSNCENLGAIDDGGPGRAGFHERLTARNTVGIAGNVSEDVAAFSLSPFGNGLGSVPELAIGDGVEVGEPVYFVTYQPTENDGPRLPGTEGPLGQPAIYGGVVIKLANGQARVLTGLGESYGAVEDDIGRGGGSGGPVFNEDGELVGLLVNGASSDNLTPDRVHASLGVKPVGSNVDGSSTLSFSGVQLVSPQYVDELKLGVDSAQPCSFPGIAPV